MIGEMRDELRKVRDLAGVLQGVERVLADLDSDRLVTSEEAARLLGLRAPSVLKVLLSRHGLRTEWRDDTLLLPPSEVARLETSAWVRRLRTLDRLHDSADAFEPDEAMMQAELDALAAARPRQLPWVLLSPAMGTSRRDFPLVATRGAGYEHPGSRWFAAPHT